MLKKNGMAVAGFVLGLLGVVFFLIPVFNFILGVLGIIFSSVGISKAYKQDGHQKNLAIAGLVLGIIATAIGLIW